MSIKKFTDWISFSVIIIKPSSFKIIAIIQKDAHLIYFSLLTYFIYLSKPLQIVLGLHAFSNI